MQASFTSTFDPSGSSPQLGQAPDPTSNGWAPSTQTSQSDGYPDDWVEADGYPDDWISPAATQFDDSYPDDWISPPAPATANSYPNDWRGSAPPAGLEGYPDSWIGSPSAAGGDNYTNNSNGLTQDLEPDGYPNDWITSGQWGGASGGSDWPQPGLVQRASDEARARPGWVLPVPQSGWEPWADQFIKGLQGIFNYFRSRGRGGFGGDRGSGDECFDRWQEERGRCYRFCQFDPTTGQIDDWYVQACRARADDRYTLCLRNDGRPDPEEPGEFGWKDIPRDDPARRR